VAYSERADTLLTRSLRDGSTTLIATAAIGETLIPSYHSPAWSPDSRRIAYVQGWPGSIGSFTNFEGSTIWIADGDGGARVRVTSAEFSELSPTWLDADHLLFVSNRDGPWDVYVVEVGSTGPRGLPRKVPGTTDAHTVSYSVDGRTLAFSKATVRRQNIWSYPLEPGARSIAEGNPVISGNAFIESHDPSSDDRWMVYGTGGGSANIYRRPVEGGDPTPVTDDLNSNADPRWSPDGTEIAFVSGGGEMVMVVPVGGGTPVQVARGINTWLPSWSPDGRHLAFSSSEGGMAETWLVSRPAVGSPWGEATQLTDVGCWPSDWAPDGSGVLCTRNWLTFQDQALLVVSPDGTIQWRYDLAAAGLTLPTVHQMFSEDGATIYAAGRRDDGVEGVWAIPVQGGQPRLVVAYDDTELVASRWLSLGPDRLYLTVQQAELDIWVADVEVKR
jgi:Tol biopolymer transport system component